jgi:hypothetical protein
MQSPPRVDLYVTVHKGIRARLFDLCVELARCDFSQRAELDIALTAYRRTVAFLHEHHQHEDEHVSPAMAALSPEILATVQKQHGTADAALAELDVLAAACAGADPRAAGGALLARYQQFLVDYLEHMQHEETVVLPAMWARYSDAELGAIRGRIQASIPPQRFAEWMEILLPAMNVDERAGMLGGMKAHAPAPVFEAVSSVAARVLGGASWEALRARL